MNDRYVATLHHSHSSNKSPMSPGWITRRRVSHGNRPYDAVGRRMIPTIKERG